MKVGKGSKGDIGLVLVLALALVKEVIEPGAMARGSTICPFDDSGTASSTFCDMLPKKDTLSRITSCAIAKSGKSGSGASVNVPIAVDATGLKAPGSSIEGSESSVISGGPVSKGL
jgi:hypothetical protein